MAIKLDFLNRGHPFDPPVYPEDWANLEDAEATAIKADDHVFSNLRKAQATWLGNILGRLPGAPAELRLTIPQIATTMRAIRKACQEGDTDRPLEHGGASSAPSSPRA